MGLFSTSSPFDADVDKATDEKNTTEEWSCIMEICDKVGSSPQNAKDCLRSIVRRLNNQDPHIVVQAITLLDACVNNCGKSFHLEVASRDFETELRKLLTKSQPKVAEKLRQLIKKWAEGEFKTDPQLGLIPSLYAKLKTEGHDFSSTSDPSSKQPRSSMPKDPNAVSSQQEVDDIAKAIELSLKETQASPKSTVLGGSSGGGTSLYPSASLGATTTTAPPHTQDTRKVRALYDFEAVEDNELTFVAGEIVHLLDDSDPNWWKGYNQRGEGLFPANFVTSDLSVEPEKIKEPKKSIQFNEVVRVKTIKPEQVEIEEDKIDKLLHMLHEADPTDLEHDPEELIQLEEQVNAMGPLIDSELEQVDRKHAQLTQVSSGLVEALNLYHMLMREPSHAPKPYVPFSPPPHPMYSRMSGPPFPMAPGPGPSHEYMMVGPPPPQGPYSMQGLPVSRPEDMQGPPSLPQAQQSIPYPNCYGPPFPGSGAPPVQPMPPPGGPFPPNGQSL